MCSAVRVSPTGIAKKTVTAEEKRQNPSEPAAATGGAPKSTFEQCTRPRAMLLIVPRAHGGRENAQVDELSQQRCCVQAQRVKSLVRSKGVSDDDSAYSVSTSTAREVPSGLGT